MTGMTHDRPPFDDESILKLARDIETHDFERIAPPAQVWNNILAEVEVDVANAEATARRRNVRLFSSPRVLAAAAAVLLMVGIAAAVVPRLGDDGGEVRQLAAAVLTDADLPVSTTETANATVECDDDGCWVRVDLTGLPDAGADADLELWVINSDVSDMHTLGLVTDSGRYDLPFGATVEDFPIVDISIEPRDGVAAHSGQSVLRGILEA